MRHPDRPSAGPLAAFLAFTWAIGSLSACHPAKEPPVPPPPADEPETPYVPKAVCPVAESTMEAELDTFADAGQEAEERTLAPLSAAFQHAFDAGNDDEALACAEEFARLEPDAVTGHLERAEALSALDQIDEAEGAFDRALALDPSNSDVLLADAQFQVSLETDDALETAVIYARRGREMEQRLSKASELASTEADALNELGRSDQALSAAESALALDSDDAMAMTERGIALFQLLRFDEAEKALAEARAHAPKDARAIYYSALLAERRGAEGEAAKFFAEAARLDPDDYPKDLDVSAAFFQKIVNDEVATLSDAQRAALKTTDFAWTDLPSQADLLAGDPVLLPTIVGVFRPADKGHRCEIRVYRKNLLHEVRSLDELKSEVRTTILHELGHLNGADDDELRDRGL